MAPPLLKQFICNTCHRSFRQCLDLSRHCYTTTRPRRSQQDRVTSSLGSIIKRWLASMVQWCALDKEPSGAGSWFVTQCYGKTCTTMACSEAGWFLLLLLFVLLGICFYKAYHGRRTLQGTIWISYNLIFIAPGHQFYKTQWCVGPLPGNNANLSLIILGMLL